MPSEKRKILLVANWKMNLDHDEALKLAISIKNSLLSLSTSEIVLCPPFVFIPEIAKIFEGTVVEMGAQNVYFEDVGAFTGEIDVEMLKDFCKYVIVGHSERRQYFAETNEIVNKKTKKVLKAGLAPIVCVGETLEAWRKGNIDMVLDQVRASLAGIGPEEIQKVAIAYEPVWAIGTANPATADYANRICLQIRQLLDSIYSRDIAVKIRILYGGSVNQDNAAKFVEQSEIDGLLIGGASLKDREFIEIVRRSSRTKK